MYKLVSGNVAVGRSFATVADADKYLVDLVSDMLADADGIVWDGPAWDAEYATWSIVPA